tara:strand:- start:28 stop:306 length:279 start_codon:yes stop_codon:yes gene_type:complete
MENENKPVNWDNHEDSQAEEFRRQLLNEAERNRLLMKTIQDLQKQVYDGYQRIKELTDEKNALIANNNSDDGVVSSSSSRREIRSWSWWNSS